MTEVLEHKIDRTGWPSGEWDTEPDRVDFVSHGYACLLLRNSLGNWCGYVGVPLDHPILQMDADQTLDVHGGITYKGRCREPICHVPLPGMPDEVMWYGFDCCHFKDLYPSMFRFHVGLGYPPPPSFLKYRNERWTHDETRRLASQLRKLEREGAEG
jgi:hypothetical protein